MDTVLRTFVAGCVLAAATASLPALAQTTAAKMYLVTTIGQTPTGTATQQETLSLAPDGSRFRLSLAGGDGSLVSVPIALTSTGAIASASQDAAITCYNMAVSAMPHAGQAATDVSAAVFVMFGNSVVRVPLTVRSTHGSGNARTLTLRGRSTGIFSDGQESVPAGIVIDATIGESAGVLNAASFTQTQYVETESHIVGRSTCALQRVEPHAARQVQI